MDLNTIPKIKSRLTRRCATWLAKFIREKALLLLQDEVPHSLAVEVNDFVERGPNLTYVSAVLYVERETQKPIVLEGGDY